MIACGNALREDFLLELVAAMQPVASLVAAVWSEVDEDVPQRVELVPVLRDAPLGEGEWLLEIVPHSDNEARYLPDEGVPYRQVAVAPAVEAHQAVSVSISHELFELISNPYEDAVMTVRTDRFWREICGPVQSDREAVWQGSWLISDWIYPCWFSYGTQGYHPRYDWGGHLKLPLAVAPGGYVAGQRPGKLPTMRLAAPSERTGGSESNRWIERVGTSPSPIRRDHPNLRVTSSHAARGRQR